MGISLIAAIFFAKLVQRHAMLQKEPSTHKPIRESAYDGGN
jgi:hypothetical protein